MTVRQGQVEMTGASLAAACSLNALLILLATISNIGLILLGRALNRHKAILALSRTVLLP